MNLLIVNNTSADLRMFHDALVYFAKGGSLSEDIADLFSVHMIKVGNQDRLIINWA